ncbi:MAG: serine/threonine protein kinase [Archangiaceae bacterium]|nr:serine/threonine protein kinase [Archangiaceae bacterium]
MSRQLGQGGMGEVWEAEHHADPSQRVALKRLPRQEAAVVGQRRRLIDEARLGIALSHPNLARTLDVIEEGPELAAVLELLEGHTVAQLVHRGQVPPLGWAQGVALQVLDGLDYLHRAKGEDGRPLGLVHRDLKPSNLFITTAGEAKIIDFGIASIQGSERTVTRTGLLRGSLPYCSPEMARHEPLDARSDLFSFGLVLYELVTGERCHAQTTEAAILSAVLWSPAPSIRALAPDAPEWLERLVARLLQKNRDDRPGSAAEVSAELAREAVPFSEAEIAGWVRGASVGSASTAGTQSALQAPVVLAPPPRSKRRVLPWVVGAGALLVAAGVGAVVTLRPVEPAPVVAEPVVAPPVSAPPPAPASELPALVAPPRPAPKHKAVAHRAAVAAPAAGGEGWLTVGVKPGWGTVEIDGATVGPSPLFRHSLGAGRHTVVVTRHDGQKQSRVVQIEDGKEQRIAVEWPE